MATEKLYWADPFASSFDADTARLGEWQGRTSLVLDRTLFYPEAGGQLADKGTLRTASQSIAIDDVQVDDDGVIHHLGPEVSALTALSAAGRDAGQALASIHGEIDRARRRDFMAQHTAQHALSRGLLDACGAATVSSRLGATLCTIDLDRAELAERDVARAEDLVNAIVLDDVPVRALFPTAEELARMDLRRAPKVTANVRVIDIDGFDLSPCGGTHCTRTGQIGHVRVVGVERYKGKVRVSFHAAGRATADARAKDAVLGALAAELTCGALDVGAAVAKLRSDLKAQSLQLGALRGELVEKLAAEAWASNPPAASGPSVIVILRPKDDVAMLRALAGRVAERADAVAICGSIDAESGDVLVVAQRGTGEAARAFDCGAWLKGAAAKTGGRGGGKAERAEGRLKLESLDRLRDEVLREVPGASARASAP
jgi:alanyl-tRNA synthetase